MLPLQIIWKSESRSSNSAQQVINDPLKAEKELDRWETMVSARLRETPYFRIDLDTCSAWAVHSSQNHGQVFLKNLPGIIEKIESGWYPPGQEGHYNLLSELWL